MDDDEDDEDGLIWHGMRRSSMHMREDIPSMPVGTTTAMQGIEIDVHDDDCNSTWSSLLSVPISTSGDNLRVQLAQLAPKRALAPLEELSPAPLPLSLSLPPPPSPPLPPSTSTSSSLSSSSSSFKSSP